MESAETLEEGCLVFAGSSERDVTCSKIFWSSLSLQPPLESRLVSGDMRQRLRPAGDPASRKNCTKQQQLEDLKTEYVLLEAQRLQDIEQREHYLQKKELVSLGYKPVAVVEELRLSTPVTDDLEDIQTVRRLD
ncbi:cilia- and flagella-associated protein HOATZ isoform X2 [Hyperolius riggenbachi]|uniref:cilia- and flagella-associated protein HOATZ isoform X2 n=1 Tax=Hyperolius riggenbachi TaxID=752182 RepID=UPI0035A362ED